MGFCSNNIKHFNNFIAKDENNKSDIQSQDFKDNNENYLIKNIINLNEKSVEDIMVPRAEIISINKDNTIEEIMSVIENESHSRMPVFDQNLDNTLGFFHIKDLIRNLDNKKFFLNDILREVLYVAPKSPILELLKRMRSSRMRSLSSSIHHQYLYNHQLKDYQH